MSNSLPTTFYADAPFWPLPGRATPDLPNQIWYFEGVAPQDAESKASIQVVFWAGFPMIPAPMPCYVTVSGTHTDGTPFAAFAPAAHAEVHAGEGKWEGAASWTRAGDGTFTVNFNGGTLCLAPAVDGGHYPTVDEDAQVAQNQLPVPLLVNGGIGWSTTLPAATVEVNAVVGGRELKFNGTGFHDTNIASGPWKSLFSEWFWARATAGPYSFVIYHFAPRGNAPGAWHTSAALWKDGKRVVDTWTGAKNSATQTARCITGGVWPATPANIGDESVALRVEFRDEHAGKTWSFDVQSTQTVVKGSSVPYGRWIGRAVGGEASDGEQATGSSSFDWFLMP